ncbi:MAG: hypothetical protein VR68_11720 [Peptococcaceae bacterium BRH_c4a]|nr:MAG: hypothetical protein VR68_11720 [Peptococcaceae bacterium BRH_c4a]
MTDIFSNLTNISIPLWVYAATLAGFAVAGGVCGFIVGRDVKQLREHSWARGSRYIKTAIDNKGVLQSEAKDAFSVGDIATIKKEVAPENGGQGKGAEVGPAREPIRKPSKKSGRK